MFFTRVLDVFCMLCICSLYVYVLYMLIRPRWVIFLVNVHTFCISDFLAGLFYQSQGSVFKSPVTVIDASVSSVLSIASCV